MIIKGPEDPMKYQEMVMKGPKSLMKIIMKDPRVRSERARGSNKISQ
jgi:hypothetical protein